MIHSTSVTLRKLRTLRVFTPNVVSLKYLVEILDGQGGLVSQENQVCKQLSGIRGIILTVRSQEDSYAGSIYGTSSATIALPNDMRELHGGMHTTTHPSSGQCGTIERPKGKLRDAVRYFLFTEQLAAAITVYEVWSKSTGQLLIFSPAVGRDDCRA